MNKVSTKMSQFNLDFSKKMNDNQSVLAEEIIQKTPSDNFETVVKYFKLNSDIYTNMLQWAVKNV
jgi:hypothetical protein